MLLLLFAILAAVSLVVGTKVVLDHSSSTFRVTPMLLLIGALVAGGVVAPGSVLLGGHFVKQNALSYDEFWNGYETAAKVSSHSCTRDGSCRHEYQCDPYQVPVTKYRTVSDGKGGTKQESYTEMETRYHDCPYVTEEFTYTVDTTLESYTVASGIFADNPVAWRSGRSIPNHVDRGVPTQWQVVKDRLDRGDPGPVTAVRKYDNYLLASQSTILKRYSDKIDMYLKDGVLPRPADNASSLQAVKAYGASAPLSATWVNQVMRFNAAFGTELQGDLHLVVAPKDVDPDAYTGAVNAYWQSPELGDKALSKNALVVVLGSADGKTVKWARAFTGMPGGNEALITSIRSTLPGVALDPEVILGSPKGIVKGGNVSVTHTDGVLESLVWGPNQFQRVCMVCEGDDDQGVGFSYLAGDIQPSTGQKVGIFAVSLLLSALAWAGVLYAGYSTAGTVPPARQRYSSTAGLRSR